MNRPFYSIFSIILLLYSSVECTQIEQEILDLTTTNPSVSVDSLLETTWTTTTTTTTIEPTTKISVMESIEQVDNVEHIPENVVKNIDKEIDAESSEDTVIEADNEKIKMEFKEEVTDMEVVNNNNSTVIPTQFPLVVDIEPTHTDIDMIVTEETKVDEQKRVEEEEKKHELVDGSLDELKENLKEKDKEVISDNEQEQTKVDMDVGEKNDSDDEDIMSWEMAQFMIMLLPSMDKNNKYVGWWNVLVEAVKCSMRSCSIKRTTSQSIQLPRIIRHRRSTCECTKQLEKLYEQLSG